MTNYESAEIGTISSSGAADVIREMADAAAARGVVELVEGRSLGVILAPGQQLHEIDLDALADTPQRKTGGVQVTNAASFALYVNRHSSRLGSTLWANQATSQIVAVLDDHQRKDDAPNGDSDVPSKPSAGLPGWGEHRATLTLPLTPDWLLWTKQDGELMDQQSFAEHIEDGAGAIHDPEPAAMLELAQTFHANTGVEFKSSNRLQSGETQLRYEETTHAKAGRTGQIAIPDSLELHLQPYENSPTYPLVARFRYRITNGQLKLGYRLVRPDLVQWQAFSDVSVEITEATGLDVLAGIPRR